MTTELQSPTDKHDLEECDLVMKGGVTSGIVYPPAILKLASKYRFRCIGGTSAGAIAAAVSAAAEYGRESGGFDRLREASDQLSKGTFLRDLFQPSPETAPLMNTLLALTKNATDTKSMIGKNRGLREVRLFIGLNLSLLREATLPFLIGATVGIGLSFLLAWLTGGSLSGKGIILAFLLAWVGGLIGGGASLALILVKRVPKNFFGLCTGRRERPTPGAPPALTDWLSENIDKIAGTGEGNPLTFGDLEEKKIHMKMMTSNLSQNLPYVLPFGGRSFIFKEREFEKLFPENVVKHLLEESHKSARVELPAGYHFLPETMKLPVIVATRLSLSFPLLLSAVPLYTISLRAFKNRSKQSPLPIKEADLQRNWFSDGGISSNFPIHFFDDWLPRRPTFGINLVSLPADAFDQENGIKRESSKNVCVSLEDVADESEEQLKAVDLTRKDVYLPRANHPQTPDWKPLLNLFNFLWSVFATAQNYRDNTQAMLPSYRERIVQLRLSDDEGGLNLAMDAKTIERVQKKGERAGEVLLDDFTFDHHRWVRFRVLTGQLEANLKAIVTVMKDDSFPICRLVEDQLSHQNLEDRNQRFPYPRDKAWCDEGIKRLEDLQELVEGWRMLPLFGEAPPLPKPVLRVTPEA